MYGIYLSLGCMMLFQSIIELLTVSVKFIDRERADMINRKILLLKESLREELSKEIIDDAAIDSINSSLRDVVSVYCAAAQGQDIKN